MWLLHARTTGTAEPLYWLASSCAVVTSRWLPAVVVTGAILALSLVPLGGSGAVSSASSGSIAGVGFDKLLHVVDYAALVITFLYATRARTVRACLVAFVAAAVLGGAIELLQGPVPTRETSLLDAVANTVGAAVATGGWWFIRVNRVRKRHGRTRHG